MSPYLTTKMLDPALRRDPSQTFSMFRRQLDLWIDIGLRQWQKRRTMSALYDLDDRMLTDIGLWRGDIPRFVKDLTPLELRMNPVVSSVATTWTEPNAPRIAA